jgi:N-acyl-D-aspartate/D-glutamate deacylase
MLDLAVRGGQVIDGTGTPARPADIGVRNGRVVALGPVEEPARRTIDASGLVVTPGFVDLHTHYDAQVFWDGTLSPSPLHGVTTVIGGNCGFSIAPLSPEDADYLMRMLARVEGMPLASLQVGVPWDWRSTEEFLDRLEGQVTPNLGFLVGHSALRRAVLHDDATTRVATAPEVRAMQALLDAGLAAGGLGLSSTRSVAHNDHTGRPVPSRAAGRDEMLALSAVVGTRPGTTLEIAPGVPPYPDELADLIGAMSRVANRPLNWNLLLANGRNHAEAQDMLRMSDLAAERGGRVYALTLPDSLRLTLNFRGGFALDVLPGWNELIPLPDDAKLATLADPAERAEWNRRAQTVRSGPTARLADWPGYTLVQTCTDRYQRFTGMRFAEIGHALGCSAWDAVADIVCGDRLDTLISAPDDDQDDASWEHRAELWQDPRVVIGASDAGAHLDMVDSFKYCTTFLQKGVREHRLLPLEQAVHLLTDVPARLYGLNGRGRLTEGCCADIVVLDPDTIAAEPVVRRHDLPGGAWRITGGAVGIQHVLVNGVEVVAGNELTDARPGTVLRSGRDTSTVTARAEAD